MRRHTWAITMKMDKAVLPTLHNSFTNSDAWKQVTPTLTHDLNRMPCHMNIQNALRIIMRYVQYMPEYGYTQGQLHLLYVLSYVFNTETELFWGFSKVVDFTYPYSPTAEFPECTLSCIMECMPECDRTLLSLYVRFKWMFIMFAQTFTCRQCICAVWDYVLLRHDRIVGVCKQLLLYLRQRFASIKCPNEKLCIMMNYTICDIMETNQILCQAEASRTNGG